MLLSVKFTRASTSTRIVNFFTRPKWSDLANKIKEVFHIPAEKVAIEVLAPAEDCMVAISNDKELCDYYRSLGGSSELLFVVHNKDSPDRASPFSSSRKLCPIPLYLANTFATWRQASIFSARKSLPGNSNYAIRCLIQGQATPFKVTFPKTGNVDDLKKAIWKEGACLSFENIHPKDLVLYQVGVVYDWLLGVDTFLAQ